MMESTTLNMMAVPKALRVSPAIVKASTKWAQSITIKPLITNENKPKVMRLMGKENSFTMGRTIIFITPSTTATKMEVYQGSQVTLSRNRAVSHTANAETRSLRINFIMLCWCKFCCKIEVVVQICKKTSVYQQNLRTKKSIISKLMVNFAS